MKGWDFLKSHLRLFRKFLTNNKPTQVNNIIQLKNLLKNDFQKIAKWSKNNPFNDEKCRECSLLPICWGGCPLVYAKTKKRQCLSSKGSDLLHYLGL